VTKEVPEKFLTKAPIKEMGIRFFSRFSPRFSPNPIVSKVRRATKKKKKNIIHAEETAASGGTDLYDESRVKIKKPHTHTHTHIICRMFVLIHDPVAFKWRTEV
jgi:hypothetical protein